MITLAPIRAARVLLGLGQRPLAKIADFSLSTIQQVEAIDEPVRGNVAFVAKVVDAPERAGGMASAGDGRGMCLKVFGKEAPEQW